MHSMLGKPATGGGAGINRGWRGGPASDISAGDGYRRGGIRVRSLDGLDALRGLSAGHCSPGQLGPPRSCLLARFLTTFV